MLLRQVALVAETTAVTASRLNRVAAALQKQASRDFGPIWEVQATVDAFDTLEDVPIGYWPIIVMDDIHLSGAAGVHQDENGQPFALVQFSNSWSLTASHECLEMLADPFGNRLIAGQSLKPGQGRVEYLVEVCDPPEDSQYAYTVNNILVSDFITPHFYDPVASTGVRYSYTGAITVPRQILDGGYISWHDPVGNHWWQLTNFSGNIQISDLGVLARRQGSLREHINQLTPNTLERGLDAEDPILLATQATKEAAKESTGSRAKFWRGQIQELTTATLQR
jgi:hypothetical protein